MLSPIYAKDLNPKPYQLKETNDIKTKNMHKSLFASSFIGKITFSILLNLFLNKNLIHPKKSQTFQNVNCECMKRNKTK